MRSLVTLSPLPPPLSADTKRVAYFLYSLVNDFHHYRYCQIPKWIRPFRAFSVAMIIFNALTLCVRWRENLDLVEVAIGFSIAFNVWFIVEVREGREEGEGGKEGGEERGGRNYGCV